MEHYRDNDGDEWSCDPDKDRMTATVVSGQRVSSIAQETYAMSWRQFWSEAPETGIERLEPVDAPPYLRYRDTRGGLWEDVGNGAWIGPSGHVDSFSEVPNRPLTRIDRGAPAAGLEKQEPEGGTPQKGDPKQRKFVKLRDPGVFEIIAESPGGFWKIRNVETGNDYTVDPGMYVETKAPMPPVGTVFKYVSAPEDPGTAYLVSQHVLDGHQVQLRSAFGVMILSVDELWGDDRWTQVQI